MIITRLKMENWMKIQQLILEFKPGINLIYGPNEIGKSSIIEAIKMAITGNAGSTAEKYRKLPTWGKGDKARVELFFTTRDNENYHILKSFPGGNAELYSNIGKLPKNPKEMQEELYEILGLPEKTEKLLDLLFINQGEAINLFKTHLDEGTTSYIKKVIKTTAFRSLEAFQNCLKQERDMVFTQKGQLIAGKDASEYKQMLDKERELKQELDKLEKDLTMYSEKLEMMETLDEKINQLEVEKKEKQTFIEELNDKHLKLDHMEKERLKFIPIEDAYKKLIEIEKELKSIKRDLPKWYAIREKMMVTLEMEIKILEKKKEQMQQYRGDLKLKKEKCEEVENARKRFEKLNDEYQELLELNKSIRESDERLRVIVAVNKEKLKEKLEELESRIDVYSKKKEKLSQEGKKLKSCPRIAKREVTSIKRIAAELNKLKTTLEAARSAVKTKFKITPHPSKEIYFNLGINGGKLNSHVTRTSMEAEDFQRLSFQYPDEFDIDISARLAEIDIDDLQKKWEEKKAELDEQMARMDVRDIEELENKLHEYIDSKKSKKTLQEQLKQIKTLLKDLNKQKSEIKAEQMSLEQDIKKYLGKKMEIRTVGTEKALRGQPAQFLRDELTKAKTGIEGLNARLNTILGSRSFKQFEKEYVSNEKEYQRDQKTLARMKPKKLTEIKQEHLENAADEFAAVEEEVANKKKDKNDLESIEGDLEFQKGHIKTLFRPYPTPRELMKNIYEDRTRLKKLKEDEEAILKGRKANDFKIEYSNRNKEIDNLSKSVLKMAPKDLNTLSDIKNKIETVKRKLDVINKDIDVRRSGKDKLSGEISNFGELMEKKEDVNYNHKITLEDIKSQLIDICASKLMLKLIEEEKEKAQRLIFKPLQNRVMESLNQLIPKMYRVNVDNNLDFHIAARTLAGDFKEDINEDLSYGTKEQVSFLLRLAIAEQLSRKEPQVMILDDSFVNTDNIRLPQLLDMINGSSKEIQFLIFTCKQHDYAPQETQFHTINLETTLLKQRKTGLTIEREKKWFLKK